MELTYQMTKFLFYHYKCTSFSPPVYFSHDNTCLKLLSQLMGNMWMAMAYMHTLYEMYSDRTCMLQYIHKKIDMGCVWLLTHMKWQSFDHWPHGDCQADEKKNEIIHVLELWMIIHASFMRQYTLPSIDMLIEIAAFFYINGY